jgi:hypothetical protein
MILLLALRAVRLFTALCVTTGVLTWTAVASAQVGELHPPHSGEVRALVIGIDEGRRGGRARH